MKRVMQEKLKLLLIQISLIGVLALKLFLDE